MQTAPENTYDNIPFEETEKYGYLNSFLLTVLMLIRYPRKFFSKMHINKGIKKPLIFMAIMVSISVMFNYVYITNGITESPAQQLVKVLENDPSTAEAAEEMKKNLNGETGVSDIIYNILLNFVLFVLTAYFWNFVMRTLHVALNGTEATVRVFSYCSVVLLSSVLPFNGPFVNMFVYGWWIWLMFIGISEAHEVSHRIAVRGVLASMLASILPLMLIFLILF